MDSLGAIFVSSFVVGLSGALMPGPVLTLTVAESARGGWVSGPLVAFGHGVLELLLLVAVMLGLGAFLTSGASVTAFGLIGGATLILMGALTVRGAFGSKGVSFDSMSASPRSSAHATALKGALTSVSNPYWVIWWATIGLGYLAVAGRLGFYGVAAFYCGHVLSDVLWYTAVGVMVSSGKKALGGRAYVALLAICGLFLVFFGGYFMIKGAGRLIPA